MPALNFNERFAKDIQSGQKAMTIRKVRKRPILHGDRLFLWTGQRTKHARKLAETTCTAVRDIEINEHDVRVNARRLTLADVETIARDDGFTSIADFVEWFDKRYGLPFKGVLIRWGCRSA